MPLMVNTTAGPLKLKKGVFFFDEQIMPVSMQLPSICVGALHDSPASSDASLSASLDSLVKTVDYPEQMPSLFK